MQIIHFVQSGMPDVSVRGHLLRSQVRGVAPSLGMQVTNCGPWFWSYSRTVNRSYSWPLSWREGWSTHCGRFPAWQPDL